MEPEGAGNNQSLSNSQQASGLLRARQNSVRFSILNESSAKPPTGGAQRQTMLESSRKEVPGKTRIIKDKPSTDTTTMDRIINEIVQSLAALNAFKEPYGRKMFKNVGSKDFWLSIVHRLLEIYEGAPVSLPTTNEGIISLIKGLGYPYQLKADVLGVIGAPHSWNQALFVLHWLAQVVETGVDPKLGQPRQSESPDLLRGLGKEETLFEVVAVAISNRQSVEEAARGYLATLDIPSEESRLNAQLGALTSEINRLTQETTLTRESQPALEELQKKVQELIQQKDTLRAQQATARAEEARLRMEIDAEQAKIDQKSEVIKNLQGRLAELEDKVATQAIDVETAKVFVQESNQNQAKMAKIGDELAKLRTNRANLEKAIQSDLNNCQKMLQEFGERLQTVQTIAAVDVSIQSPGDEYRRAVIELQAATESRLSQNRQKIEEMSKQLAAKQMQIGELESQEKGLKELIERVQSASKKIRDRKILLEREKTSKEKDLESKKLQLNNEVLGLSNQLDRLQKDINQVEFESQTAGRELEQAKGLILQAVEQNRVMLLALKKEHVDKLGMEDARTAAIKSGLTQYLATKKK